MAILTSAPLAVRTGNLFLDSLPSDASVTLLPQLRRVPMQTRHTCTTAGKAVEVVHFPLSSVVSVVARMRDGGDHEVGVIGREGVVGGLELLFRGPSLYESFVQIPDSALALDAAAFRHELASNTGLAEALLRFAQATLSSTSQSAACNGSHPVEERCAKWILVAHDRVPGDVVALTHEFLGQMLNVRRAGVTNAALHLQKAGAISYTRGKITVSDRSRLEDLSCECYKTMNDNAALILGYDIRKTAL